MGSPSDSSSGEEDGSVEWRKAIESVVATTIFGSTNKTKPISRSTLNIDYNYEDDHQQKPQNLKHYQIKAQNVLDDIIEKNLEMVRNPMDILDNDQVMNEGGVRLFKNSSPGIIFDHRDEFKGPSKKPRILPGKEIDMKSKKFKQQLQRVVVDGVDILAEARDASQKSLARLEAKDAAAKAKVKREEERVAELKRDRGERWLPSVAREMQLKRKRIDKNLTSHM